MSDLLELPKSIGERGMTIGGDRVSQPSGGHVTHVNPATGRAQGQVPMAGDCEVEQALAAARGAARGWADTTGPDRAAIVHRWADLVLENAHEFRVLAALETGATHPVATKIATSFAAWARYYAGWADKIEGHIVPIHPGALDYVLAEPCGVVLAIVPWNAPVSTFAFKVIPALAAGNTVVVKPSDLAPFSVLRLAELAAAAGVPHGVLSVLPGGAAAGEALVRHPDVDKISFTGGGETAKRVLAAAAEALTPVVLELGGKSPNLIFSDADLDAAATMATMIFRVMSGQACATPSRLLVERPVYHEVCDRVVAIASTVRPGDPLDPEVDMGPVITEAACERILGIVEQARRQDAGRLVVGGARCGGVLASGFFLEPTVFVDACRSSDLVQNEIFGPVLAVMPFDDDDEAVILANDSQYALGGYVHTTDLRRAHRVARQLSSGYIGVNSFGPHVPGTPFGGNKSSGWGREGGRAGLQEFLKLKNIYVTL